MTGTMAEDDEVEAAEVAVVPSVFQSKPPAASRPTSNFAARISKRERERPGSDAPGEE